MLVDELQDKHAEQVDCEQEKLTLPDTGSQSENSQTGSEPIIQNEPEDDDDEEEMLPGKPACITKTLWKHFKRCESLRIKLDAEDDDE
ncbi:unnamed protein product [Dibothriocephalus latus]|uniref:Uncharacterized protein n=1 Tax=Dibothriocephalus latus TaxID=60516 RepID=A0A3P7KXH1_DIBLA|nr:unnamed protein product [Dibothriocephalus latus]